MRVLVLPAATEIGLEIYRALRYAKGIELVAGGYEFGHADLLYDEFVEIPNANNLPFVGALAYEIVNHKIDVVFPAHDDVGLALSRTDIPAIVHSQKTHEVCRSKLATYRRIELYYHLEKTAVHCPDIYGDPPWTGYPLFAKPDCGSGSQGSERIDDYESAIRAKLQGKILLEYISGDEVTIDCFSDSDGELLWCLPRTRQRIRSGISMRSLPYSGQSPSPSKIALAISKVMDFRGAWHCQFKYGSQDWVLLEVSPRIAGTSSVSRMLGVNLPLLSLYQWQGLPVEIKPNNLNVMIDRSFEPTCKVDLSKRTDLYVDLDDTLIVDGKLNHRLVAIVAKHGKAICLSRNESMIRLFYGFGIEELFDGLYLVNGDMNKVDRIDEPDKSILVDDSFRERCEAQEKGVLAIDLSQLELLE